MHNNGDIASKYSMLIEFAEVEEVIDKLLYEHNYLKMAFPLLHPKLIWDAKGDFKDINDYDRSYLKSTFTAAPTVEQAVLSFFHYHLKRELLINPTLLGNFKRKLIIRRWLNTYSFHTSKDEVMDLEYPIMKEVYSKTFNKLGIKFLSMKREKDTDIDKIIYESFFSYDNPTLELGHICYLGQSKTAPMGALYRNAFGGGGFPYYMGCYNLDVELIVKLLS